MIGAFPCTPTTTLVQEAFPTWWAGSTVTRMSPLLERLRGGLAGRYILKSMFSLSLLVTRVRCALDCGYLSLLCGRQRRFSIGKLV